MTSASKASAQRCIESTSWAASVLAMTSAGALTLRRSGIPWAFAAPSPTDLMSASPPTATAGLPLRSMFAASTTLAEVQDPQVPTPVITASHSPTIRLTSGIGAEMYSCGLR